MAISIIEIATSILIILFVYIAWLISKYVKSKVRMEEIKIIYQEKKLENEAKKEGIDIQKEILQRKSKIKTISDVVENKLLSDRPKTKKSQ